LGKAGLFEGGGERTCGGRSIRKDWVKKRVTTKRKKIAKRTGLEI